MATATHKPDSDYLMLDLDDQVRVCRPDGTATSIGHVASPRTDDACPEELRDDLATLYRDFLRGLRAMPVENFRLVRTTRPFSSLPSLVLEAM